MCPGYVHTHQRVHRRPEISLRECDVHRVVHVVIVAVQLANSPCAVSISLFDDALDVPLFFQAIANQVGDRADPDIVFARETLKVGTPRHAAIFIQNLDDRGRRFEARQAREVAARFRVSLPASVTPPGCAITGKIWPGWLRCSGFASLATATCTVRARS